MSMWEIDEILKESISIIQASEISSDIKKNTIWNLENLPQHFEMDAGSFEKQENDSDFDYQNISPYELGLIVCKESQKNEKKELIYHWSAFLVNFWEQYFIDLETIENLKSNYLEEIKLIFSQHNFDDFEPLHATLTIYPNGNDDWFSKEQNSLMRWFMGN